MKSSDKRLSFLVGRWQNRKPLLGAPYGIFWSSGKISLDATLEELNIDDIPPSLTKKEKMATVSDLLKSRSGVYH